FAYKHALLAGISQRGIFTTDLTGANQRFITQSLPSGHPLPASLERILWQPAHDDRSILYAISTPDQHKAQSPLSIQLILSTLNGQTTTLTTCPCTQFAWSPDGNRDRW